MGKFDNILSRLSSLPLEEQQALLRDLQELENKKSVEEAQSNFLPFVRMMWPAFVAGRHHKIMADAFERIANGTLKRLIVNMPPRHTKSEFASYLFPAWFMGRFPHKKIIQTANTADLAVGFGRKVKNLIDGEDYQKVFSGTKLASDSKAAGRWATSKQGEYYAIGVGGTVTGKGADVFIIDDPHSEQDAIQAIGNPEVYDSVYDWYTSGPRQRLQPGGAIIVVMCMVGETDVTMADGTHRALKDIKVGDLIATYDDGIVSASRVLNFQSSGVDTVFTVKTRSGRVIRANGDHPFLVEREGVRKWAKMRHLRPGLSLVGLMDVNGQPDHKESRDCAKPANQKNTTTERTQVLLGDRWASMVAGRKRSARAASLSIARACAQSAIESNTSLQSALLSSVALDGSNPDTESRPNSIGTWWMRAVISAMYAEKPLPMKTRARIGMGNFASTIATKLEWFAGCCATTATSLLDMVRIRRLSLRLRSIYDFTPDEIVEVSSDGREEVFDIEVERTGNFIADGVVSHNTRWSKRDLTGKIIDSSVKTENGDKWEVIEFPAIMPSGEPLWPEFWPLAELEATKAEITSKGGLAKWNAQYMQNPTSEEGALIKREWWRKWERRNPPECEAIIQSWDTAFLKTQRADYSACTTWGVFYRTDDTTGQQIPNVILLDAYKEKLEFPELKKRAREKYNEYEPDQLIIEKKASGAPLIFELRQMGLPVTEFTPTRGNDKIARVNAVSDLFSSGCVWYPDKPWADEVIEECASFPSGDHDDYVDSASQALIRFRQGGWIRVDTDDWDDEEAEPQTTEYY